MHAECGMRVSVCVHVCLFHLLGLEERLQLLVACRAHLLCHLLQFFLADLALLHEQQQAVLEAMLSTSSKQPPTDPGKAANGEASPRDASSADAFSKTGNKVANMLFTLLLTSYAAEGNVAKLKALLETNPSWDKTLSDYDRRAPV